MQHAAARAGPRILVQDFKSELDVFRHARKDA
jgi:hypothetical protein